MKTLSIVIPAHDEDRYFGTLLERVDSVHLAPLGIAKEVIVVDDGSRDRTAAIAAAVPFVRLHRLAADARRGKEDPGAVLGQGNLDVLEITQRVSVSHPARSRQ